MVATVAELEVRVTALEVRVNRHDEDIAALIQTTSETKKDVKVIKEDVEWLKTGMTALLEDRGLSIPPMRRTLDEDDLVEDA